MFTDEFIVNTALDLMASRERMGWQGNVSVHDVHIVLERRLMELTVDAQWPTWIPRPTPPGYSTIIHALETGGFRRVQHFTYTL